MKLAVMQPYFAPYLGYFQLINAVDKFVFFDVANFIKGGWINRNYITLDGKPFRFSVPLKDVSSFKKINEIEVDWGSRSMNKLQKTFRQRFSNLSPSRRIVDEIFAARPATISEMAMLSIEQIAAYLDIETQFSLSSDAGIDRQDDRSAFLINLCKLENATTYINSIGGQELYSKDEFRKHNIDLQFIDGQPGPSLLDTIDSEPKDKIIESLSNFRLI